MNNLNQAGSKSGEDAGFTLVELIVYSVLLIILLGIAATLFIQILVMQRDIGAMTDASNTAQLTFNELERDLRNASAVNIYSDGELLILRTRVATAGNDSAARCVGYHVDSASGELRRTVSESDALTSVAAGLSGGALSSHTETWAVARDGVTPIPGHKAFGPQDKSYSVHQWVELNLSGATINDRPPVEFKKSVTLRHQGGLTGSCI